MALSRSSPCCLVTALATVLLLSLTAGEAVRCFRCQFIKISDDNDLLIKYKVLALFGEDSSGQACLMKAPDDKYALEVVECPQADDNHEYKCGTTRGSLSLQITSGVDVWLKLEATNHGCLKVANDDLDYDLGCKHDIQFNGTLEELLQHKDGVQIGSKEAQFLTSQGFASIRFEGRSCYNATKTAPIAVPDRNSHIQCVTCANNLLTSETPTDQVKTAFSKESIDACLLQQPEDKYQVGSRICPLPPQGKQPVCAVISGVVSGSDEGKDFGYERTKRGCCTQPTGMPLSGCKTGQPSNATKDLLQMGAKFGEIKFVQVCYNNDGFDPISLAVPTQQPLWLLVLVVSCLVSVLQQTAF